MKRYRYSDLRMTVQLSIVLLSAAWGVWVPATQAAPVLMSQNVRVSAGSDDAEQHAAGYFSTTSSDLEMAFRDNAQTVGMRFKNISIPPGAVVSNAYIQFQVDEATTGATSLVVRGEAAANAATFSASADLYSRVLTAASVPWIPAPWPTVGAAGLDQRTPNLAPVIQEIVGVTGWAAGNSLAILIDGSGIRVAESFEGLAGAAPLLHIDYFLSSQDAPVVDAGVDQAITQPASAFLNGDVQDDGLPVPPGTVVISWEQLSGPGTANFVDAAAADTAVSFTTAGTYVLRLSAFDGERNAADDVTITVNPASLPPVIASVLPLSGQVATVVTLTGSNFSSVQQVRFKGTRARFRIASDNLIYATVPPGATNGVITVSNPFGATTSAGSFSVIASPAVLISAGDIANCVGKAAATALLIDAIPGTVQTVGDHAYENSTAADFAACYEPTWGRHKSRTRPAIGNHEYKTPGAVDYFNYFGPSAGDPDEAYYSYELGEWHIVVLNSQCAEVGGCGRNSPQGQWLLRDLASNPAVCTAAVWHHPRFSSANEHGSDATYYDFWEILHDAGAELVVSAHDHVYERFTPQDAAGVADPFGMHQFVVGTGGANLYGFNAAEPNSAVRNSTDHGVLKLVLNSGNFAWEFVPIAGKTFTDSGTGVCRQVNQIPVVDAGPDQWVNWPANALLAGSALDDGAPGSLTVAWSQLSGPGTAGFSDRDVLNPTVNFSATGRYVLRLTANDGEHVQTDEVVIFVVEENAEVLERSYRVAAGADDAEENNSNSVMYLNSSDLELVDDFVTAGSNQTIGIRFNNVAVPKGATILSATVQFQVDEPGADPTALVIRGEATDNSPAFTTTAGNISNRARGARFVNWEPPSWLTVGAAGPGQQTPDLSALVQEIVNRSGWASGNSLSLIIDGAGLRIAESFEGAPGAAPLLAIQFTASGNARRVVSIDVLPGDSANIVYPNQSGNLPVAVLSSADFDATQVKGDTLRFGLGEATRTGSAVLADVDGQFGTDKTFRFPVQDSGIVCNDTEVSLYGETISGELITGTGAIDATQCETGGCHVY